MSKATYAGTSFDLPSDKWFWRKCGELDSIVEFQECTHRAFLNLYKAEGKGRTFDEYCKDKALENKVDLGRFNVTDYQENLFASYLVTSFAAFDNFLQQFILDTKELGLSLCLKPKLKTRKKSISIPLFEQVTNALKSKGIHIPFEKWNKDLYRYYKCRRNVVSHQLDKSVYINDLKCVQKYRTDLARRYPTIVSAIDPSGKLSFDDFRLCTANLKNIAHMMSVSIETHINWKTVASIRPHYIDYHKISTIHFDASKRVEVVRNAIRNQYGISLSESDCKKFL